MTDKQGDALLGISKNMEKSLKKIEEALTNKGTSGKGGEVSGLAAISGGAATLSSAVSGFKSKNGKEFLTFTEKLVKIADGVDLKKAESFGNFASGLGEAINAIIDIVDPMKLIKLYVGTKILFGGKKPLLATIVEGIGKAFESIDPKQTKEGTEAIKDLGEGLAMLSKSMALVALIGIAAPLIAVGALVLWGVIKLFSTLGKNAKDIEAAGKGLQQLGKGLMLFSAGLAVYMLVLTIVSAAKVLEGIVVLAAFGVTFALLGMADRAIREGGQAIAWMGLGIFAFSAALATYMLVLMIATPELIFKGIFVLSLIGATFAAIGVFDKQIREGGKAFIEVGFGLMSVAGGILAFGIALKLLQLIFGDGLNEAGAISAAILLGLGGAFAAIGRFGKFVEEGAKAMLSVGFSLMSIAGGLLVFGIALKLLKLLFKDDLGQAAMILGGVLLGLGLVFAGIGFAAPLIAPGAAAMISVGFALMSVSAGILVFGLALKALLAMFKNDIKLVTDNVWNILLGVGTTFATVGLLSPFIILGSAAVLTMGVSLLVFSASLFLVGRAIKYLQDNKALDPKTGKLKSIPDILLQMGLTFTGIGIMAIIPTFGMGIAASIGMGVALASIAGGLIVAAKAMEDIPQMDVMIENLFGKKGLINTLADNFAAIGNKYAGGFMGFLSGLIGADPVSKGIGIVSQFGEVLQSLAGGIVAFADFTQFPVKVPDPKDPSRLIYKTVDIFGEIIPALNENLPSLLTVLADVFGGIGMKYGGGNWLIGDSPVTKGIKSVKGIGSVLSELAGGIVAFANFSEFPVKTPDSKGKLIYKTVDLWAEIPKIKQHLVGDGINGKNPGLLFSLASIFGEIGRKYGGNFFVDGDVKAGSEAVSGIGSILSELAGGILAFAKIEKGVPILDSKGKFTGRYQKIDLNKVKHTIRKVLSTIPAAFAGVSVDSLELAKEKADLVLPLAKTMSKLAEAFSKIEKIKSNESATIIGTAFNDLSNALSKMKIDNEKLKALERIANASKVIAASSDKFGNFSKNVGVLKENVNKFNIDKLKLTDSMMRSLASLAKSPDISKQVGDSIEKAIKDLTAAIKTLGGGAGTAKSTGFGETAKTGATTTTEAPKTSAAEKLKDKQEQAKLKKDIKGADLGDVLQYIYSIKEAIEKLPTASDIGSAVVNKLPRDGESIKVKNS